MKQVFILICLVLSILITNLVPTSVLAQQASTPSTSIATSSASKSTFELFWPLTAGSTIDSPLYFLKILKENLRGMLIFAKPQKVEYQFMLVTKRILEADKLFLEKKDDLANQTLNKAIDELNQAEVNFDPSLITDESKNKINNLEKFLTKELPFNKNYMSVKNKLDTLNSKIGY